MSNKKDSSGMANIATKMITYRIGAASKSLGHDINTHFRIYNSTYDQIDAMKASIKINS